MTEIGVYDTGIMNRTLYCGECSTKYLTKTFVKVDVKRKKKSWKFPSRNVKVLCKNCL